MATLTLRNIPKLELEHLLTEQLKNRLAKERVYSLEMTVLKIVREHKELNNKKNSI